MFDIVNQKDDQKKMLDLLLKREDCIAVSPTGYGKSLPYQMLVPLRREMCEDDKNSKAIVCSPLVTIMRDQCERLNGIPGVKAVYKAKQLMFYKQYDGYPWSDHLMVSIYSPTARQSDSSIVRHFGIKLRKEEN